MNWTLHSEKLFFVALAPLYFDTPIVGRCERLPTIIATVATAFLVVILCTFGVSTVESSLIVHDKGPNMQNIKVCSKVEANVPIEHQHQHSHQLPLYKSFEHKMGKLSEYARDRFDSSRVSRLNQAAELANSNGEKHVQIDGGLRKRSVSQNTKHRGWHRRKRQTVRSQSLIINDKRLHQLRPNEEVDGDDRFSTARWRMRKVLSVLIPNQRRHTSVHGIWGNRNENVEDNADSGQQKKVKNYQPEVLSARIAPYLDGNWMESKANRISAQRSYHQQNRPKYLQTDEENGNNDGQSFAILPFTNACELCASSFPSASASFRCCTQDAGNEDDSLNPKQHHKLIANQTPPNKSKRQTEQKVANLKAINPYQTLSRNQKLGRHEAVYPEIVAKTSSILSNVDNYRQPQTAARLAGNSYADFLNYYDQHQQVARHNLLSSSLLSSGMSANAPPPPTSGENLFPSVPNINITAHGQATNPFLTTNTTTQSLAPDYYNNNSSHLSTPLTTNAPSASSVNNATTGAEAAAGGGSTGGEEAEAYSCAKYIDAGNTSAVLQRVLDELERIRMFKEGQLAPEGSPCSILGSWNSEIIGLRFDINKTNVNNNPSINSTNSTAEQLQTQTASTTAAPEKSQPTTPTPLSKLTIRLFDHKPPKRNTLMNTNWSTLGTALNFIGGPFSITATVPKEQILATFTGICKTCGGQDTIFGTWSIAHPAKDCGDLQTAIETRRDIFRREMMFVKKQQRLEQLRSQNNVENSTKEVHPSTTVAPLLSPTQNNTEPARGANHKQVIHSADSFLDDEYNTNKEPEDDDEDY